MVAYMYIIHMSLFLTFQIGELSLLPSLTGSFGKNVMETKKLLHKNKKMFFQYIMYVYGTSGNKTSAYYVTPTFFVSCP